MYAPQGLCDVREEGRHRRADGEGVVRGQLLPALPEAAWTGALPGIILPVSHPHSTEYTLRRPVMGEVLSTIIWGVPPAGGPRL